jgi:hypothetical protein
MTIMTSILNFITWDLLKFLNSSLNFRWFVDGTPFGWFSMFEDFRGHRIRRWPSDSSDVERPISNEKVPHVVCRHKKRAFYRYFKDAFFFLNLVLGKFPCNMGVYIIQNNPGNMSIQTANTNPFLLVFTRWMLDGYLTVQLHRLL